MKDTFITSATLVLTSLVLSLFGQSALAHEGHHAGGAATGIWHMLTQPDHWLLLFGLVAIMTLGISVARVRTRRKTAAVRSKQ